MIDYRKIYDKIMYENPHDIDRIIKLVNDVDNALESLDDIPEEYVDIDMSYEKILNDHTWTVDEKVKLIRALGYNNRVSRVNSLDKHGNKKELSDIYHTIRMENISSFEALMRLFDERYKDNKRIEFNVIMNGINNDESYSIKTSHNNLESIKAKLTRIAIDSLSEENKIDFFKESQSDYNDSILTVHNISSFRYVVWSKDLELIEKNIDFIDDVNIYLNEAVSTGRKDIVKLFLEKGADVNYIPENPILGRLTPLKTAIACNDIEMVKFLVENGADVNFSMDDENFDDALHKYNTIDYIESFRKNDAETNTLKYIRYSSPFEYATKLNSEEFYRSSMICFEGYNHYDDVTNFFYKNSYAVMEGRGRAKIISYLFDKVDKSKIDFNDLIISTLIAYDEDGFNKYKDYIQKNNIKLDINKINSVADRIENHSNLADFIPQESCEEMLNSYLERTTHHWFSLSKYAVDLLRKIPKEKRLNYCLVPRVEELSDLKTLLELGFDINQTDEKGNNILLNIIINNKEGSELFDYLIENVDLSMVNNAGENALYLAFKELNTKDDYMLVSRSIQNTVFDASDEEEKIIKLIDRMDVKDVCSSELSKLLDKRITGERYSKNTILPECIYHCHKYLFEALSNKGFKFSNLFINTILNCIDVDNEELSEAQKLYIQESINVNETKRFVFEVLDHYTKIDEKELNENKIFEDLINFIKEESSFSEFKEKFKEAYKRGQEILEYNKKYVSKRCNKDAYRKYMHDVYNKLYDFELDQYMIKIIILALRKYGNDKIDEILDICPKFDVNAKVFDLDFGMGYYEYYSQLNDYMGEDDDGFPRYEICGNDHFEARDISTVDGMDGNISFDGGLIQYAVLIDDLELVKKLEDRGANLKFIDDEIEYTWDYVNSYTMLNYMELKLGSEKYNGLNDDERQYYMELLGEK